ncbi:DUF3054 domain-containing protein [Rhodococcus sp. H36-A4]|uniref:DUF3054 domain-containing protein n=1 Tax=Rhodococcus sp. H36-A4 TaxID=3004353 RepID=UPI0022AF655B|nr:DUF3054 domain-containing protein [Rhodococcus sp. H36-A4]MCZ4077120.1 DUF3054 domain-containing protein [Rhodococcus sp. H36-A4]
MGPVSKRNPIIAAVPGRFAPIYIPAVIDLVLVLIFCAVGRRSHDESGALAGLATTAWPFLIGAVVGWAATWALYRNKFDAFLLLPTGIIVWVSTVAIGMVLRAISGQGTAFSFVVVATTVLALFLLGWRALARAVSARKN